MGLFDKVGAFLKREAEDIGEVAERARERFDEQLTEREAELKMTPSEKVEALQRKGGETEDRFDAIVDKAEARASQAHAEAEVEAAAANQVDVKGQDSAASPDADTAAAAIAPEAVARDTASRDTASSDEVTPDGATPDVGAGGDPATVPGDIPTEPVPAPALKSDPVFDKTPAQIKYEQAREAADALLNELRGELKADGEV